MGSVPDALAQIYGGSPRDNWTDEMWRKKYQFDAFATSIPIVGDYIRYRDNMAYMDDYMTNRGLSYKDILYPSRTVGGTYGKGTLNFVSSNIKRLYR